MNSRKLSILLLAAVISATALFKVSSGHAAKGRDFALGNNKVKMEVPASWQDVKDGFGIPLMFLGPEKSGGRPVITVVPTGMKEAAFDVEEMKRTEDDYQQGRREWLRKYNGVALAFNGLTTVDMPGATEAHSIGYRYRIQDVEFNESSYYVICKKQFYHLKTILRGGHEKDYAGTVNNAIKSFSCE